ncbi:MAG: glycosyltransferase, partial [Pseudobdellovibrionaceae bacterium]
MLAVDVVIATQYRPKLLKRCLHSLREASGPCSLRFVVSSSGSSEYYGDIFAGSQVVHTHSDVPLNAAAARNRALPHLQSEWVYFIDDDAHVEADFFSVFARLVFENPEAAVIG